MSVVRITVAIDADNVDKKNCFLAAPSVLN
jgi:hypothetical protein